MHYCVLCVCTSGKICGNDHGASGKVCAFCQRCSVCHEFVKEQQQRRFRCSRIAMTEQHQKDENMCRGLAANMFAAFKVEQSELCLHCNHLAQLIKESCAGSFDKHCQRYPNPFYRCTSFPISRTAAEFDSSHIRLSLHSFYSKKYANKNISIGFERRKNELNN